MEAIAARNLLASLVCSAQATEMVVSGSRVRKTNAPGVSVVVEPMSAGAILVAEVVKMAERKVGERNDCRSRNPGWIVLTGGRFRE